MTVRHCPGCRGYTGHSDGCAGIPVSSELAGDGLIVPDVVPPLGLLDRLRVLIGSPVLLGMRAGPLGEPFETVNPDDEILPAWMEDPDDYRKPGRPR